MKRSKKFLLPLLVALIAALGILSWQLYQSQTSYHHQVFKKNAPDQNGGLESYFNKAQLAQPQAQETTATFLAAGDIMLSRNVAGTSLKAGDPLLPYTGVADLLSQADFNFANLESPLSGSDHYNPNGNLVFNAVPSLASGLKKYNFQVLNLANNHAVDQGAKGLQFTAQYLDQAGIKHEGVGNTLNEAWQPAMVDAHGIKIAFIGASYASANDGGQATNNFVARIDDVARLRSAVATARQTTDFVVVTMHAGTEYTRKPNQAQTDFAHAAIDAGADIVIGAHPHWIQTVEKYNGKYSFYSLGNFIFDQMWSQETSEGLVLKITVASKKVSSPAAPDAAAIDQLQGSRLGAQIKQIELVPLIIDNFCCPRVANEQETRSILSKINQPSIILPDNE